MTKKVVLNRVEKIVQAGTDDIDDVSIVELRDESAERSFGRVREAADRCSRYRVQRDLGLVGAVMHRSRKLVAEQEEAGHRPRGHPAVRPAIGFEGARRAEQGPPLQVVDRLADVVRRRQQQEVLHVEDAGRLVGALDEPSDAAEVPCLGVLHRLVLRAFDQVAGAADVSEERVRVRHGALPRVRLAQEEVEPDHRIPLLVGEIGQVELQLVVTPTTRATFSARSM